MTLEELQQCTSFGDRRLIVWKMSPGESPLRVTGIVQSFYADGLTFYGDNGLSYLFYLREIQAVY